MRKSLARKQTSKLAKTQKLSPSHQLIVQGTQTQREGRAYGLRREDLATALHFSIQPAITCNLYNQLDVHDIFGKCQVHQRRAHAGTSGEVYLRSRSPAIVFQHEVQQSILCNFHLDFLFWCSVTTARQTRNALRILAMLDIRCICKRRNKTSLMQHSRNLQTLLFQQQIFSNVT